MDLTLHTYVHPDGRVEGKDYIVDGVLHYEGIAKTRERNQQRFQYLLQERLTRAFSSADIAPELQNASITAIADTIRDRAATRPAIAEQAQYQQPGRVPTPSAEAAHRPY